MNEDLETPDLDLPGESHDTVRGPSLLAVGIGLGVCTLALIAAVAIHSPGPGRYRELVEKHSVPQGVEPELVLAMMSVESRGKLRALSPKGAVGLMQVMPATAEETAMKIGMSPPIGEELFDPDINIHLGVAYMAKMLAKYENDVTLALGAYNAGPRRVDKWRKKHPGLTSQQLCEQVFYKETRAYVAAVLRKRRVYRASSYFVRKG